MPNWTAITDADLDDTKVAALVSALRTAALGSGQDDPVDEIVADSVARVRTEVASGGNQLDDDATKVPVSLKRLTCRLIIWSAKGRLNLEQTDQEKTDHSDDLAYLRRIADGKVSVETPDDAITPEVQSKTGIELVSSRTRIASQSKLDGLL